VLVVYLFGTLSKSIYPGLVRFQGFLWILEPEKIPKPTHERSSIGPPKETKDKKTIVEVFPAKKTAKIKGHSLILSSPDGSHTTIQLLNCTVLAVSASSMPSRKWLV
jgi:hypothetical protein